MADIYTADLTSSAPGTITLVNTDASNIQNFAGPYPGLQQSNANSDGFNILGFYHNVGIAVRPGRVFELTYKTNITQVSASRHSVLGIGTANSLDAEHANFFSIYRYDTNAGISCNMASESVTPPVDQVFTNYSIATLYTARIKIQPDGSAKAYLIDPAAPAVEIFLGSSYSGLILQKPYTNMTTVYFAVNGFKTWASGDKSAVYNTIRVYDAVELSTIQSSGSADMLTRRHRNFFYRKKK
jgi:hypothetical protein